MTPQKDNNGSALLKIKSFKDKGDGKYYFQFSDEKGSPLVLSKPYPSASKRNAGLGKIYQYAADPERYKKEDENGQHFFEIRAGNNQVQARSIRFESKQIRDQLIQRMCSQANREEDPARDAAGPEIQTSSPAKETQTLEQEQQPRYNFDLTFYPNHKGEKLIGKIEHTFTKEKRSFTGIDLKAIGDFIHQFFPAVELKTIAVKTPEKPAFTPPAPDRIQEGIEIFTSGHPAQRNMVSLSDCLELEMDLSDTLKKEEESSYQATVYARPLMNNRPQQRVGTHSGHLQKLQDKAIRIPVIMNKLIPSVYEFNVVVDLYGAGHQTAGKNKGAEGKCLVKIVDF